MNAPNTVVGDIVRMSKLHSVCESGGIRNHKAGVYATHF
jgi:hypothetical protein